MLLAARRRAPAPAAAPARGDGRRGGRCSSPSASRRGGTSRSSRTASRAGRATATRFAQTFHDLDDIARQRGRQLRRARHAAAGSGSIVAWGLAAVGLVGARGGPRLVGASGPASRRCAVVALGMTLVVSVFQLRTGFGAQGRHVLPVLVLVPLWAGEVLRRRPDGLALAAAGRRRPVGGRAGGRVAGERAPRRGRHRRLVVVLRRGGVVAAAAAGGSGRCSPWPARRSAWPPRSRRAGL